MVDVRNQKLSSVITFRQLSLVLRVLLDILFLFEDCWFLSSGNGENMRILGVLLCALWFPVEATPTEDIWSYDPNSSANVTSENGTKTILTRDLNRDFTNASFFLPQNGTADDDYPQVEFPVLRPLQRRNDQAPRFMLPEREYTYPDRPHECRRSATRCIDISSEIKDYLHSVDVVVNYEKIVDMNDNHRRTLKILRATEKLKNHHDCWNIVQPVAFAVALPKCWQDEARLIPVKQCIGAREKCGIKVMNSLPKDLDWLKHCNDSLLFSEKQICEKETSWFANMITNISSVCPYPLVHSSDPLKHSFNNGFCGLQCENAFLSESKQDSLHAYVAVLVIFSFIFNGSAFTMLALKWRNLKKYPDQFLLFINVCFIMSSTGWALQFIPGTRERITCSEDGTERMGEPRHGEGYSLCLITFILIYYFTMAAAIWFVSMTYCWYRSFKMLCTKEIKAQRNLKTYSVRFHIAAWVTPLLLTLIVIATSGIDGNHISGICFIGLEWASVRGTLLITPLLLVAVASTTFVGRGLSLLHQMKKNTLTDPQILSACTKHKIRSIMLHIGLIAVLVCLCIFISLFIHIHYYIYRENYVILRDDFVNCHLRNLISDPEDFVECLGDMNMDFETVELDVHLALHFVAGIIFSSWVWRRNHLKLWVKTIKRTIKQAKHTMHQISTASFSSSHDLDETPPPLPVSPTANNGIVNSSFEPDTPAEIHPHPSFTVSGYNSATSLYDLAPTPDTLVYSRSLSATPSFHDSESVVSGSIFESITMIPVAEDEVEDRLSNWQDRARQLRQGQRKIPSVPNSRQISASNLPAMSNRAKSINYLRSISMHDGLMNMGEQPTTPGTKKQRRQGRVEYFKQGRPRSVVSPARSISQGSQLGSVNDGEETIPSTPTHIRLQVPGPTKSILKIRSPSPMHPISPDEGIDLGRGDVSPKDHMTSDDLQEKPERVHIRIVIDDSEA